MGEKSRRRSTTKYILINGRTPGCSRDNRYPTFLVKLKLFTSKGQMISNLTSGPFSEMQPGKFLLQTFSVKFELFTSKGPNISRLTSGPFPRWDFDSKNATL